MCGLLQDELHGFLAFCRTESIDAGFYVGTIGKGEALWLPQGFLWCEAVGTMPTMGLKLAMAQGTSKSLSRLKMLSEYKPCEQLEELMKVWSSACTPDLRVETHATLADGLATQSTLVM